MKKSKVLALSLLLSLAMGGCNFGAVASTSSNEPSKPNSSSSVKDETSNSVESSSNVDNSSKNSSSEKEEPVVVTVDAGDAAAAIANPGKFFYTKDDAATVSGVVEEGVSKITVSGMTTQSSVVFYYEAPNVTTGSRYELSFNFKSKAVISYVTINGTVYELAKGDNTISFRFTETDEPTLTIVMGEEGNEVVTESNEIELSTPVVTDVQYKALAPVVDGSIDEWKETKNEENSIGVVGTGEFAGKSVRFLASLQSDGLYIAAEAYHGLYVNNDNTWHFNTNLEFFIAGRNQGYIAANGSKQLATDYEWTITGDAENGYHSIVEGFIPTENLPAGSVVAGEIRVGWA